MVLRLPASGPKNEWTLIIRNKCSLPKYIAPNSHSEKQVKNITTKSGNYISHIDSEILSCEFHTTSYGDTPGLWNKGIVVPLMGKKRGSHEVYCNINSLLSKDFTNIKHCNALTMNNFLCINIHSNEWMTKHGRNCKICQSHHWIWLFHQVHDLKIGQKKQIMLCSRKRPSNEGRATNFQYLFRNMPTSNIAFPKNAARIQLFKIIIIVSFQLRAPSSSD